ncbi:MAG: RHS repeat domain-containing protein, partial [Terracidiphilus sp.]
MRQCWTGYSIGRLTNVADVSGLSSVSYDQLGNPLTNLHFAYLGIHNPLTNVTKHTYDAANRIASITYPGGLTVSYTRDIMGRITAVAEQPSGGT